MTNFVENSVEKKTIPINILDIGYIGIIFMITFLVSASWIVTEENQFELIKAIGLNAVMLSLIIFTFAVYLIGKFSGKFQGLKVITPLWIPIMFVSFFIWIIYSAVIPLQSSSGQTISSAVSETSIIVVLFILS